MKSAGNDIVALTAVDVQRTVSPNFYSKFIIPAERELYEQSSAMKTVSFCSFVWLLWSVKESAYKFVKRLQPDLIFSPSKFVVEYIASSEDFIHGVVSFQDIKLHYHLGITKDYIETIVDSSESFDGVHHEVIKIDSADSEKQSEAVRQFALQKIQSVLNIEDLSIEKSGDGYPIVIKNGDELDVKLSFAHHDLFVGYSFNIWHCHSER